VITIGKVIHGLELLVDNADASFMSTAGNSFNIRSSLAHVRQLLADSLGGFDCSLGVEFG
jgi:hypothetical protein